MNLFSIFAIFLRLGCTSFGGPIAHIGYFRHEFVEKRGWLDEHTYADLVALCNFLPGPSSSQVGMALGISRAGLPGGLAAWLGFTMPSAVLLTAFAYGLAREGLSADAGWLHGLKIVAVAVIAQAVWGMSRTLCPDRLRAALAIVAAAVVLLTGSSPLSALANWAQLLVIVLGGLIGWRFVMPTARPDAPPLHFAISRRTAVVAWILFAALLLGLPLLAQANQNPALVLFDKFYRSGSLVFGGGHVVLPLLRNELVPGGWVNDAVFLAGYGATQAAPGPLFTFAAFLGAVNTSAPSGVAGATLAIVAIFLPSFLLVTGALPFWDALRRRQGAQAALAGVNAAVVGLLIAALYTPVWISSIKSNGDFALALAAFGLLTAGKAPPLYVVLFGALGGWMLAAL
jgi:chromate transporter